MQQEQKEVEKIKSAQLHALAEHRDKLRKEPHLRWLFFEVTDRCNLRCKHCGSSCTSVGQELSVEDVERTLQSIRGERPMICLTGGEPLLHPDFFKIAERVTALGFDWGMTTNGTLIDDETAERLRAAGLATVSVSVDGMEKAHNDLRGYRGAWHCAIRGVKALQNAGLRPQVTTVVHSTNISDLDPLYAELKKMEIKSWRIINVEPIGRACEEGDMLLTPEDFTYLISFIREKRYDPKCPMEVTFGCSHYLGVSEERMVRDHYFLCAAGILTASVRSNGDICACLDIEERDELVQGNIKRDDFMTVWLEGFEAFRRDRTAGSAKCSACPERYLCGGDSTHTWDFDKHEPRLCYRDYLIV